MAVSVIRNIYDIMNWTLNDKQRKIFTDLGRAHEKAHGRMIDVLRRQLVTCLVKLETY